MADTIANVDNQENDDENAETDENRGVAADQVDGLTDCQED